MANPMMKCGCVAQGSMGVKDGKVSEPPLPACVIHDCTEIASEHPDMTNRRARCSCGKIAQSNPEMPFFQFRGDGSPHATETCKCGYTLSAHTNKRVKCENFTPKGAHEFDSFYCGCRGWD